MSTGTRSFMGCNAPWAAREGTQNSLSRATSGASPPAARTVRFSNVPNHGRSTNSTLMPGFFASKSATISRKGAPNCSSVVCQLVTSMVTGSGSEGTAGSGSGSAGAAASGSGSAGATGSGAGSWTDASPASSPQPVAPCSKHR